MTHYAIQVKGRLADHWSEWFDGLRITHDSAGNTLFSGELPDQAALFGVLAKVRDMGLILLSVQAVQDPVEQGQSHANL